MIADVSADSKTVTRLSSSKDDDQRDYGSYLKRKKKELSSRFDAVAIHLLNGTFLTPLFSGSLILGRGFNRGCDKDQHA